MSTKKPSGGPLRLLVDINGFGILKFSQELPLVKYFFIYLACLFSIRQMYSWVQLYTTLECEMAPPHMYVNFWGWSHCPHPYLVFFWEILRQIGRIYALMLTHQICILSMPICF